MPKDEEDEARFSVLPALAAFASAPAVVELVGREWLAALLGEGVPGTHHPLSYLARADRSWRLETLKALDRAIDMVRPVLERTNKTKRFSTRLRIASEFNPAVAELIAAARFTRMTTSVTTMVIDPAEGGPDVQFDLGGRRVFAEVYAPKSWRDLDVIDAIRVRLPQDLPCRFNLTFTRSVTRDDRVLKRIAQKLKDIASQMVSDGTDVVTFFGDLNDVAGWTVVPNHATGSSADNAVVGWAYRDDGGTVLLGSADPSYVPTEIEAKDAMSDLGQLVDGATNILAVDLSGRLFDPYTERCYEAAAMAAGERHPSLSAVLVAGRSCRLRPAPSKEFEACSWYRVFPNPLAHNPLSPDELSLLGRSGLVVPGAPS